MQKLVPVLFIMVCIVFVSLPKVYEKDYKFTSIKGNETRFDNLGFDTLSLSANYSECGEWGGHREKIYVYMSGEARKESPDPAKWQGPLHATWLLDTIGCSYRDDRKYVEQATIQLTSVQEAAILKYAQELTVRSLRSNWPVHGGNAFSLRYDKSYIRIYPADEWDKFDGLRAELFSSTK